MQDRDDTREATRAPDDGRPHERGDAPADPGFTLSEREKHDVEKKLPPRPAVLHETIRVEGEAELKRKTSALLWSAVAAGLSMGFSMLVRALLHAHLADTPGRLLIESLGYTSGFLIVVLARQQLFTEITLTAVLPVMTAPSWTKLGNLLRMWTAVFAGNLLGVALFAYGIGHMQLFDAPTYRAFTELGMDLMRNTPLQMFTKGIFAGWLIATMVWLLPAATHARIVIVVIITYFIALGGFTHVIIGSTEAFYLVFSGELGTAAFAWHFALPTLAGNVLGGSVMFALISHAQVRSDEHER